MFGGESVFFKINSGKSETANTNPEPEQDINDPDLQSTSTLLDQVIKDLAQQRKELKLKVDEMLRN